MSRRESVEPSPEYGFRSVFIKNFHPRVDKKTIYDMFSAFGNITQLRVAQDRFGTSRGYGFVEYDNEESVKKAIEKINGILLYGKRVHITNYISREERDKLSEEKAKFFTNLYVDNFGDSLSERQFYDMFEKYGRITSYRIMRDDHGKSKGFGFVAFNNPGAAKRAVDALNGKEITKGKPLHVGRAQRKEERKQQLLDLYKDCNLYVSNLNRRVNDDVLRKEFSRFGTIVSARVMLNDNRESKGFGFVCFSSKEEAMNALRVMKGSKMFSNELYVSLAQNKEDRQAHLLSYYEERMANMRTHEGFVPAVSNTQSILHRPIQASQVTTNSRRSPLAISILENYCRPTSAPSTSASMIRNGGMSRPFTNQGSNETPMHTVHAISKFASNSKYTAPELRSLRPLTSSMLDQVPPKVQKEMLGEKILPSVMLVVNDIDMAYKITGMLLGQDNSELLFMLDHCERLKSRIEEARATLECQAAQNPLKPKQPTKLTKVNKNLEK